MHYLTGPLVAWTDEWTDGIRRDERIPDLMAELWPEQLPAFAEWQQTMRDYFRVTETLASVLTR